MTRRIVITGGSGLIGGALVRDLAAAGDEVVVLSRDPERRAARVPGARLVVWLDGGEGGWRAELDGAFAVVHLAGDNIGAGRWTARKKARVLDSRVRSGSAVAAAIAAARRPPQVLIQASAVGYYGPHGDETLTEASPTGHDFLAEVCRRAEASTGAVEACGVRRVVVRTGIVLSAGGGVLPRFLLPYRCFVGGRMGSGRQWMSWIHLTDEVAAIRFALECDRLSGPLNLTAPRPERNADFGRTLGRVLRRPSSLPAPAFALRWALGEMATLVLDGQKAMPDRLLAAGFAFRFVALEPALRDLLAA